MRRRILCLVLCLLCLLAAPAAAQVPNLSNYHIGSLHLDLSQVNPSQLEIRDDHLREVLCGESGAERGGSRKAASLESSDSLPPGETCRLVIANDGGHGGNSQPEEPMASPFELGTTLVLAPPCGVGQILLDTSPIKVKGRDPIVLPGCGTYAFKAMLSATYANPSLLNLLPAAFGQATGQFSGSLPLRLDLSFVRLQGTGEPYYLESRELLLDVAGRWTVVQTSNPGAAALPPGETNLALFVDRKAFNSSWSKREGCGTVHGECTKLCLGASSQTVNALNGLASAPL